MDLDVTCLRWAKAENIERMLRALGVPLPPPAPSPDLYHRRLVRTAALAIEELFFADPGIALAIFGLLLGGMMVTLSSQAEQRNRSDTTRRLEEARELLIGFVHVLVPLDHDGFRPAVVPTYWRVRWRKSLPARSASRRSVSFSAVRSAA